MIHFTVPGRPSRWMRPGQDIDSHGRVFRFTDKRAEAGKKEICRHARRAFGLRRPFLCPVIIRVVAIYAIPPSWPDAVKRAAREGTLLHMQDPDLDQLVKQAMDAIKGVAYLDDNQVAGFSNCAKRYGEPERTEITIQPMPAPVPTPGQRRLEKKVEEMGWEAAIALALNPPRRKANPSNTNIPAGIRNRARGRKGPGRG